MTDMREVPIETKVAHSPLPWRRVGVAIEGGFTPKGHIALGVIANVMTVNRPRAVADADFIVRACNSHQQLVGALAECSSRLAALVAASGDFSDVNAKALDQAQAALVAAQGEGT